MGKPLIMKKNNIYLQKDICYEIYMRWLYFKEFDKSYTKYYIYKIVAGMLSKNYSELKVFVF